MAKRQTRRAATRSPSESSMTCPPGGKCGPGCVLMGLIAVVLSALGLWMLVGGVMKQWGVMPMPSVVSWYAGGFLLLMLAKGTKMKLCGKCRGM